MTPGLHTTANRVLAAGLLCLGIAAAAYETLQVVVGPRPIFIHIRWAPAVDDAARQAAERRYSLSEAELLNERTWGYTLGDASRANIRALVTDAAVEDTQDIDRAAFRAGPSAPPRPYPPSDSRLPIVLWGLTVLCVCLGLTGVSLGLLERAGADTAADQFERHPTVNERPPMRRGLSLLLVITVMGGCFLAARSMEARVDEPNHLEQIDRYAGGDYFTDTGTFGGFHASAAIFRRVTGLPGKEGIRLFVLLTSGVTILVFLSLMRWFEPQASTMRTLQFVFLPLLFPFWFLIYTDVYALMFLLLAVLALTRDRFYATGILMALSVLVRQTNIIWLVLLGVWTMTVNFTQPLRQLIKRGMSFGIPAALFLLFVMVNGGVAIGRHRDSHPDMEFQTENLLYMLVCFFLMFLPLILSKLPQIARLHRALLIGVPLSSVALFFGTFRVDHPWNTKWQDIFLRNAMLDAMTSSTVAGVVTSLAIALAVLALFVIRLRQPVHYLIYPFGALSVMPVWLIEQRYYIPVFALFMLFRESASPGVERAMVAMNAVVALYLFVGIVQGWFFL